MIDGFDQAISPGVGRLDDIANRNKRPWKLKNVLSFGLRSLFLLIILALLIFTKWAIPPKDDRPGINVIPPPPPKEKRIDGVKLWTPPKK
jgi:hypothetical protein